MNNLQIDRNEILRYLGYGGQKLDTATIELIDKCIDKLYKTIKPKFTVDRFKIKIQDEGVLIWDTDLVLKGKDIRNHLEGCGECAILTATLGVDVDNLIRISQNISMSEAVVLDACAVEFAEKVCDNICVELEKSLKDDNLKITSRFSPGYGDLSLEIQSDILRIADANRKIGLTVTDSNIMLPRKSVTAIIGIYNGDEKKVKEEKKNCENCNFRDRCMYRKRGARCND